MANEDNPNPPPDPFTTPLAATATVDEIETHRKLLEDARKKELTESERFHLEQSAARNLSAYHQRLMAQRLAAGQPTTRVLNFDDDVDTQRAIDLQICATAPPGGSRPTTDADAGRPTAGANAGRPAAGATVTGAPPPPRRSPPPEQSWFITMPREFDAQGLPLYSAPMDNIIATQAAIDNLNVPDDAPGVLQIRYTKALLDKAVA